MPEWPAGVRIPRLRGCPQTAELRRRGRRARFCGRPVSDNVARLIGPPSQSTPVLYPICRVTARRIAASCVKELYALTGLDW